MHWLQGKETVFHKKFCEIVYLEKQDQLDF